VHAFTRMVEFDYVSWTLDAFASKFNQNAISTSHFLTDRQNEQMVRNCFSLVTSLDQVNQKIDKIYADPSISDPASGSAVLAQQRTR